MTDEAAEKLAKAIERLADAIERQGSVTHYHIPAPQPQPTYYSPWWAGTGGGASGGVG